MKNRSRREWVGFRRGFFFKCIQCLEVVNKYQFWKSCCIAFSSRAQMLNVLEGEGEGDKIASRSLETWGPFLEAPGNYRAR